MTIHECQMQRTSIDSMAKATAHGFMGMSCLSQVVRWTSAVATR